MFPQQFTSIHLYTWMKRGTESKVSCLRTVAMVHVSSAVAWGGAGRGGGGGAQPPPPPPKKKKFGQQHLVQHIQK